MDKSNNLVNNSEGLHHDKKAKLDNVEADQKSYIKHDWAIHYSALLEYLKIYGHCNVPKRCLFECVLTVNKKTEEENDSFSNNNDHELLHYKGKLGLWLVNQRSMRRNKYNGVGLLPEREVLLQQLVDEGKMSWDGTSHSNDKESRVKSSAIILSDIKNKEEITRREVLELEWNMNYKALLEFRKEFGHCNVPRRAMYECTIYDTRYNNCGYPYKGYLGVWLTSQRKQHKSGSSRLNPDRERKLQDLVDEGVLSWDMSASSIFAKRKEQGAKDWPRHYAALKIYYERHGHCNVHTKESFTCELPGMADDGGVYHYSGRLGVWLSAQRNFRKFHPEKLKPEREAMLQQLVNEGKLKWDVSSQRIDVIAKQKLDTEWPLHMAALKVYGIVHGHYNVPVNQKFECDLPRLAEDGGTFRYRGNLGSWLATQRKRIINFDGQNAQELQTLLNSGSLVSGLS